MRRLIDHLEKRVKELTKQFEEVSEWFPRHHFEVDYYSVAASLNEAESILKKAKQEAT